MRQLVLVMVGLFFALALLDFVSPSVGFFLRGALMLEPEAVVSHLHVWQLITYAFLNFGIINTAFSLITLWFTGSMLEDSRGPRWFLELFYLSAAGGALLAVALTALPGLARSGSSVLGISTISVAAGVSAPLFGVLVAFALLFGDVEFLLFFLLRIKAKYMVILGTLLYLATLLREKNSFNALLTLCCGLAGFLYVKFAHRNGLATVASERYFGLRNDYYRWKRRRAARKFEVYMRKQDRVVKFDEEGRYIPPEDERHPESGKDPRDRRWMN